MIFPQNPTDGDLYKGYKYDADKGAWIFYLDYGLIPQNPADSITHLLEINHLVHGKPGYYWIKPDPNSEPIVVWSNLVVSDTYGKDSSQPASSGFDILVHNESAKGNDGVYWIQTENMTQPHEFYCDMTTDGGGWVLTWSNLRQKTGRATTNMTWDTAINSEQLVYNGVVNSDIEGFETFTGLKFWNELGGSQMMYKWSANYNRDFDQIVIMDGKINTGYEYALSLDSIKRVKGTRNPGMYDYHNHRPFTTQDRDNDDHSGNCGTFYSRTPWWYGSCWSGNINGGGENTSGYYNGAYWYSSHRQWGNSDGAGAGNGWIFVR